MARHNSPNFKAKMRDRYKTCRRAERYTEAGPVLVRYLDGTWRMLAAYTHDEQDRVRARRRITPTVLAFGTDDSPTEWQHGDVDGTSS